MKTQHKTTTRTSKAGQLRTVPASLEQIQFDGEDCIVSTLVDITGRRQAEEALRESEELYRLIAQNTEDITWTMNIGTGNKYIRGLYENFYYFG